MTGRNANDSETDVSYGSKKIKEFLRSRKERMEKTRL